MNTIYSAHGADESDSGIMLILLPNAAPETAAFVLCA